MGEDIKRLSFPSDIVASYQSRLLLYGALDMFFPTTETRIKELSFALDDAMRGLEVIRNTLEKMGWDVGVAEAEGRRVVMARRRGITVGVVASEAEDGGVLTVLMSYEADRALGEAELELSLAKELSGALKAGGEEGVLKSGRGERSTGVGFCRP